MKGIEKDRFSGQSRWIDQGTSQSTQSVRVPMDWLCLLDREPIEGCKKSSISSSSYSFAIDG